MKNRAAWEQAWGLVMALAGAVPLVNAWICQGISQSEQCLLLTVVIEAVALRFSLPAKRTAVRKLAIWVTALTMLVCFLSLVFVGLLVMLVAEDDCGLLP